MTSDSRRSKVAARGIFSSRGPDWLDLRPLGLLPLTLLVYYEVTHYPFVNFDDDAHVYENHNVATGLTWENFRWAFTIHGPSQWHPLAWLSHQLDCELFGLDAGVHHAVNLGLHALGTVLLCFALRSLTGRRGVSLFVAAMFAVHPLNVESVAWVSERRNVLCGVFWMLGLIAYGSYARRGGWFRYLLVAAAVSAALMSKPLAVTLPSVFLLLDFWPLCRMPISPPNDSILTPPCPSRPWSALVAEKLPLAALAGLAGWLSYLCQQSIQTVSSTAALPVGERVVNALASYGLYLRRVIWPDDLAVLYPHPGLLPQPDPPGIPTTAAWGLVLLAWTVFAVWGARRRPAVLVGWLWFLGTLVPMIGLVQVGLQQLADRYVYIAIIGLGLMFAGLSDSIAAWAKPIRILLAMLLVAGWSVSAWMQVGYWSDSTALWSRTLDVTRSNSRAHLNLGQARYAAGDVSNAVAHYKACLQLEPGFGLAWYNLGVAYHDSGQIGPALECLERAVLYNPEDRDFWMRLGGARGHAGDLDGAMTAFRQALSIDPSSAAAHINLGLALEAAGRIDEAVRHYALAVESDPFNDEARALLTAARLRLAPQVD